MMVLTLQMMVATDISNDGTDTSNDGTDTSNDGTDTSNDGTDTSNDGTDTSNDGTDTSNDGTDTSNDGTDTSNDGTDISNDGTDISNDGTDISDDGTDTSNDGTGCQYLTITLFWLQSNSLGLSALGELSLKRLTEKLSELHGSPQPVVQATTSASEQISGSHVVENSAFNNITDQHLWNKLFGRRLHSARRNAQWAYNCTSL